MIREEAISILVRQHDEAAKQLDWHSNHNQSSVEAWRGIVTALSMGIDALRLKCEVA